MKLNEYNFNTPSESIELTYRQANGYFEDVLTLIENSKFDLFNSDEELSYEDTQDKYNELNRRLQTLGQAFELYMKYIIHSSRLEQNPNMNTKELWDNWIRGHRMIQLINEKANSDKAIPGFKNIFNKAFNAYYGIQKIPMLINIANQQQGICSPEQLFEFLQPSIYEGFGTMTEEQIENIIVKNTAIYEKCRYNVEVLTDYNINEVFEFLNFVKFFARMIHSCENKTKIDYNVAYVKAMATEPIMLELLQQYRERKEIEAIISSGVLSQDSRLLAYMLSHNTYSLSDIEEFIKIDESLKNPKNLGILLSYNIDKEELEECKKKDINIMMLASNFTISQVEKFRAIPVVGDYINDNPILVNRMITQHQSDVGLIFEDWYNLLSNDGLKRHPECIKGIVTKYMDIYHYIEHNKQCNEIFEESNEITIKEEMYGGPGEERSKKMASDFSENIIKNIELFESYNIKDMSNIPVMMDHKNVKRILELLRKNEIETFSPSIFLYPYNEVLSIVNYMKNSGYDINDNNFQKQFWEIYDKNSVDDTLLHVTALKDEFLENNGLIRKKNERYCIDRSDYFVSRITSEQLPNKDEGR